jgi:hypothetical protein
MHAFICLILCVASSSVVGLQVINMSKYIQSTFVLVPIIQGIHIGFSDDEIKGNILLLLKVLSENQSQWQDMYTHEQFQ